MRQGRNGKLSKVNRTDKLVIQTLLKHAGEELTLQEIVKETGGKPEVVSRSLCNIFQAAAGMSVPLSIMIASLIAEAL